MPVKRDYNRFTALLDYLGRAMLALGYCSWQPWVSYIEPIIAGLITLLSSIALPPRTDL